MQTELAVDLIEWFAEIMTYGIAIGVDLFLAVIIVVIIEDRFDN